MGLSLEIYEEKKIPGKLSGSSNFTSVNHLQYGNICSEIIPRPKTVNG